MKSLSNLEEVKCNICDSEDRVIIFKADIGNIVRCKKCGLFYRSPRLSAGDEISRYQHQVFDDSYCDGINQAKRKIYISTLKKIDRYKGRILDIGCSNGYFLALAQKRGWEPYGIEISDFFLRKAREKVGDKFVTGVPLKMAKFPSDSFDVITMWDVLDHLRDPSGELLEIRRILKKNGLLIIRVRNMSFHMAINRLVKKNLFGIIRKPTVFHLYGFNNQNIRILLSKANFSNTKTVNSRLTAGDPYSQTKLIGSLGISFIKRIYWILSEFIRIISWGSIFISPSIIIHAEKT